MIELVDVSAPLKLSPRAKAQVSRKELQREELEAKIKALDRDIIGIVDNDRKHADEDDLIMTGRLQRYRLRQGMREVRHYLTGEPKVGAGKRSKALQAFEYIYRRCRDSGWNFEGTPIAIADIAADLDVSERQTYRLLDLLENGTAHGAYAFYKDSLDRPPRLQTNPGLILRLSKPGQAVRFAITLPESAEYRKEVLDSIGRSLADEKSSDERLPVAA